MKQLFITGLALMLSGSAALAQYADDPYSNSGSNNDNRSNRYEQDQRYNQDNYNNDSYNDEYGDGYIDYDDDSYTTRFRRFNDVYAGYNYWSPVYSPYWAMPVYMDPWYYSPYRMGGWGISLGWSWGNPYWNSGWGMCNWWGYNAFNYWHTPYMGWGGAFGYGGFGYGGWGYGGFGYGWGYGNGWAYGGRGVNYGPRRSYGSTVGAPRGSNGIRPNPGTVGSGRDSYRRRDLGINPNGTSRSVRDGVNQNPRNGYTRDRATGNNGIRLNEGSRRTRAFDNSNLDRSAQPRRERNYQSDRPDRVAPREATRPSRTFDRSEAPSRSYSAPAPSRSNFNSGGGSRGGGFGGGSGGGGSRGGGGGYRR